MDREPRRQMPKCAVRRVGQAARLSILLIAAFVVLIDQMAKDAVTATLGDGRVVSLPGGLVRLDYTRNTGAAFGIFPSGGALFAGIAIIVGATILAYAWKFSDASPLVGVALGLVLGGAVGNLVDRVHLGYVVDFIDLRWWPVFNLADSAIVLGVGLLMLRATLGPAVERGP